MAGRDNKMQFKSERKRKAKNQTQQDHSSSSSRNRQKQKWQNSSLPGQVPQHIHHSDPVGIYKEQESHEQIETGQEEKQPAKS